MLNVMINLAFILISLASATSPFEFTMDDLTLIASDPRVRREYFESPRRIEFEAIDRDARRYRFITVESRSHLTAAGVAYRPREVRFEVVVRTIDGERAVESVREVARPKPRSAILGWCQRHLAGANQANR